MRIGRFAILPLTLGCASAPPKAAGPQPAAEVVKIEVKEQTLTEWSPAATIKVTNPGEATLTVTDAEWKLVMDEKVIAKDEVKVGKEVPGRGEAMIEVVGKASYAKTGEEVQALAEQKSLEYALHGDLALSRPGGGEMFLEWGRAGSVRTPRMPNAHMYTVQATRGETQIDLVFLLEVSNPNPFEIKLAGTRVSVSLNDRPVGEHQAGADTIPAGGGSQYSIPITVTQSKFGKDLVPLARQNKLRYKMTGEIDLHLVKVPVALSGGIPFSS